MAVKNISNRYSAAGVKGEAEKAKILQDSKALLYPVHGLYSFRSVAFDRWDELVVSDGKIWNYRVPYPEWLYGAAGLNISALDLAKFDTALSKGTLLSRDLLTQMWTTYRLTDGEYARFTASLMANMQDSPQVG